MSEPQVDPSIATPQPQLLQPGDVVDGRYRVEAFLGGGGMATVYRATHVVLEQPVALKIVSPQVRAVPGVAARFIREARAATSLKGAHVARVFDVGTMADGAPYMVMEFLDGKDLGELLELGPLPPVEDAVDWALQACEALAEVHGRGIVHRDLKPANLFLTRGADGLPCVKLIDFGISRVDVPLSEKDAAGLTHPEAIMGSPRYMSPETMESATKADARSDIWGLGACLYELLVGHPPYDGGSFLELYAQAMKGPPPAPSSLRAEVPKGLDDVVLKCLRVDPSERYADVAQLAAALEPFAHEDGAKRVAAIARVLGASSVRPPDGLTTDEDVPFPLTQESSRVRRRVSREPARKTSRVALVLGGMVVVGAIVAFGALARVKPIATPLAPPPAPTAEAPPAQPTAQATAPAPAPEPTREPAPAAAPPSMPAPTPPASPRTNADARVRRAPRHAPVRDVAPEPPPPSPPPVAEPPSPPPPAAPAPSPSPDNGKLFEDRK